MDVPENSLLTGQVKIDESQLVKIRSLCRQLNHNSAEFLPELNEYTSAEVLSNLLGAFSDDIIRLTIAQREKNAQTVFPFMDSYEDDYIEKILSNLRSLCSFIEINLGRPNEDATEENNLTQGSSEFPTAAAYISDADITHHDDNTPDIDIPAVRDSDPLMPGVFEKRSAINAITMLMPDSLMENVKISPDDFANYGVVDDSVYYQYENPNELTFVQILETISAKWKPDQLRVIVLCNAEKETVMAYIQGKIIKPDGSIIYRDDLSAYLNMMRYMTDLKVMKVLRLKQREH